MPEDKKLARQTVHEAPDYFIDDENDQILYHLYTPVVKRKNEIKSVVKQIVVPVKL